MPEAPNGGHNTHVGALLDAVPVALPAEPPELVEEGAREALADVPVAPPPGADPVAALPAAEPTVAVLVGAEEVVVVVFAPVAAVEAAALLPSVTTPRLVTP
jgi:hypothetical protein